MKPAVSAAIAAMALLLLIGGGGAPAPADQANQANQAGQAAPASPGAAAAPGQLQFARLNRTYSDIVTEIEPIQQGPVTVRLSSPRHQLTVRNHLLRLEPGPGGSHSAELRVDFSGKGWLVADVDVAGMGGRLED